VGSAECMVGKIVMSVDIIVRTLSVVCPLRQDITMSHGHGVDNCSHRICRKGRHLDLGESSSVTQIVQWNLRLNSYRLWAYVCIFGADGDDCNGDEGDGDDGDDDGVGDGDYSIRTT
jgi:hypothetical protein